MRAPAVVRYEARGFALPRPAEVLRPEATGQLRAGAASVDITPVLGLDLAGFGFRASRHSEGSYGRLRGTCLLLEGPDGNRVLLVATDLLAGSRYLTEGLARELAPDLGLTVDRIWLCASHTHAAPGHIFGERFYDCLASRANDFDVATADTIVRRLAAGARRAAAGLVPARVGVGDAPLWGLVWQRSLLQLAANLGAPERLSDAALDAAVRELMPEVSGHAPPDGISTAHAACDARCQAVWAESLDGRPLGVFAVVHGTPAVLPAFMALISPDAAGVASRRVHHALHGHFGSSVPVGIVAGIMGDTNLVDPTTEIGAFRARRQPTSFQLREDLIGLMERVARGLADGVLRACARAREDAKPDRPVVVRFRTWEIPEAAGPGYRMPAEHQVGNGQFGGSELNRAPLDLPALSVWSLFSGRIASQVFLRWLTGEPSERRRQWWWPVPVRLPIRSRDGHSPKNHLVYDLLRRFARPWFGRNVRSGDGFDPYLPIRHLELGEHVLVGLPLEPSTVLSHRIRQAARSEAPHRVVLVGLCGSYVGYATTVEEYRVQDYEGAATVWGRDLGTMVVHAVGEMALEPGLEPGSVVDGEAFFDTDVRRFGPPVALQTPPRPSEPFAGEATLTIGPLRDDVVHLGLPALPEPHDDGQGEGDVALVALARRVRDDVERRVLWGRWFSEMPAPSERFLDLGEGWCLRLEARAAGGWVPVRWGPCVVDDTEVSAHLRRGLSADGTRVRWTWSLRLPPDLVPDGTEVRVVVADRPGLRPIEGTVTQSWVWRSDGRAPLAAD